MAILLPYLLLLAPNGPPAAELQLTVEHLRSSRGSLHFCLTRVQKYFPDCSADPNAIKRTAPASEHRFDLGPIPPGQYALAVMHDENANGKLDMMLGIPREGFGFSRNPKLRFSAPKFNEVRISLMPGFTRQSVRMQYLL
jgi:uncharacterized protein (DUF2141 family)